MIKICLFIHSLGIGGMERVMHQLVLNFAKKENVNLHLVLIGRKREIIHDIPESVTIHKPKFDFSNERRIIDTLRTSWFIRSTVKKINPDTILSFGEYWNNLVLLSLIGLSYPVYISDRSQPNKDLGYYQNKLRQYLYPFAKGYIAQTLEAKNVCLSKGWNSNIKVIGNPIRAINGNGIEEENIVLTVGRLIESKHFDQLIRIFASIRTENWKLKIVGGDAKKKKLSKDLQKLIERLEVADSVSLEGEQIDIEKYYLESKIFAFTSSSEGFPNVIGEAMSAGLPVVSYDCCAGPSDLIAHKKTGYLVPIFDQDKFGKYLKKLMVNAKMRENMGSNAREEIKRFSSDNISDDFYSFITRKI